MVPWGELVLFMLSVGFLALYGLAASGHFPAEFRAPEMRRGGGAAILWATIVLAALAAVTTLGVGAKVLPWYAIVIGGGMMLLFTPLALRVFPDRFVNGSAALLTLAAGAVGTTVIMWVVAHGWS
jgi:hypothetical protein